MIDQSRLLFIHGLEGSSQGFKATLLRHQFPDMVIPDFPGELQERMDELRAIMGQTSGWTLIGSSLGGLMATAFALEHPDQVRKLILLAPALPWLPAEGVAPVDVPAVIYHGRQDLVVPLDLTRTVAERILRNLTFLEVDDDHGLGRTVKAIDWPSLLDT